MPASTRGALIVLEGCDRAGKSTQCRKLVEQLVEKGIKAELMRFPDRTTQIGTVIGQYLERSAEVDDHAVHLLFSANRWERVNHMESLLLSGTTLVVDRYAYSGVAYSAAKQGLSLSWCKAPDAGLPKPDLVAYLNLPANVARARTDFGKERYESCEFQAKVAETFSKLHDETWKVVDASGSIDEVHAELVELALGAVRAASAGAPLARLWCNDDEAAAGSK